MGKWGPSGSGANGSFGTGGEKPPQIIVFFLHGKAALIQLSASAVTEHSGVVKHWEHYTPSGRFLKGAGSDAGCRMPGPRNHANTTLMDLSLAHCGAVGVDRAVSLVFPIPLSPGGFRRLLAAANALAARANSHQVRVDFYLLGPDEFTFSELTYTSAACWMNWRPRLLDTLLGELAMNRSSSLTAECIADVAEAVACTPAIGAVACSHDVETSEIDAREIDAFMTSYFPQKR